MAKNRIKVYRAEVGITAANLGKELPDDLNKIGMCILESGKVLPTKQSLIRMCEIFGCKPSDLYSPDDIDLLFVEFENSFERFNSVNIPHPAKLITVREEDFAIRIEGFNGKDHEGMEQVRVWLRTDEKLALTKVVKCLGYTTVAEWFREMYRATVQHYIALGLNDDMIHQKIPPTTVIKRSDVLNTSK